MNVEIGTEAAQFLEKEYINGIFLAVHINGSTNTSPFSMTLRMLESTRNVGCVAKSGDAALLSC